MTLGPGGVRNDGKLIGISICTDTGFKGYFPIGHPEGNMDKQRVLRWAKDIFARDIEYVGANVLYDLEWLRVNGVEVTGTLRDIQIAEPLMNEELDGGYSLEALAKRYLDKGKDEEMLKQVATIYKVDPKSGLWKLPAQYVGPYAEADAELPLRIWDLQKIKLKAQDLWEIFELESKLLHVVLDMRFRGVAIDMYAAEQLNDRMLNEEVHKL